MVWYLPWSESIKKRACRYLLQRYLGNFLEEKLTLDQLSVDLYNGTGTVSDVSLDCEALNDLGDSQNWPLEIIDGHMKEITVNVPWSTLLKDDSVVEIHGLSLTVQPKVRIEQVPSMLESMWSSMSSSMQLAAECLRDEAGPQESNPVEGIEMFAHAIDSILCRVKVKFINTKIRIEHVPKNGDRGIALEIHIKNVDYYDEAEVESKPDTKDTDKTKSYIVATCTNKKIKFDGVTFYIDEFPSRLRTMAPSLIMEKSTSSGAEKSDGTPIETPDSNYQSTVSDIFYETRSVTSTIESDHARQKYSEDRQSTRDATPYERAGQPDPILFAKLTGEQELVIKLKHNNEVEGPKIQVNLILGSFVVFITPRQLHTIIELVDAINQPQLEDTSNLPIRQNVNMQCKPMKQADFQFIEAQLLGNFEKQHFKPMGMCGWSGPSYEESDDNEKFLPMTSQDHQMTESFSSVSSMNTSVTSSVNTSTSPKIKRNKKAAQTASDPSAEVSHISVRVAALACVLLHKDIRVPAPGSARYMSVATAKKLQQLSSEFFKHVETFGALDETTNGLAAINTALDTATGEDHLRLLTLEISLDGSEKVTPHGSQAVCEASVSRVLVRECVYHQSEGVADTPTSFDIVRFENKDNAVQNVATKTNVKINIKQTSKYMYVTAERKLANPATDIVVKCMPFSLDVDLSLLERMSASVFGGRRSPAPAAPLARSTNCNFTLQCPNLNILLRFPIADLRAGGSRATRRVRADYLVFRLQTATLGVQQTPALRPLPTTVTLSSTALDLYYHENKNSPAIHIAKTTMDESTFESDILKGNVSTHLPTISVSFRKEDSSKAFDSLHDELNFEPQPLNPMTTSMYVMKNLQSSLPSPFSGKKIAHQSITKKAKDPNGKEEKEDEIIVPGTEEEVAEFTDSAVQNSAVHLDFNLPILSLQLESKQVYEVIYNRINSDLLLWEPRLDVDDDDAGAPLHPAYGFCNGMAYGSDTDASTSDDENMFASTWDGRPARSGSAVDADDALHNFCLTFKVAKGLLTIYSPVRDSNKRVVPGQMGELALVTCGLALCHVSGLRRRPRTAQLGLRARSVTLYHEPILSIPSEKPGLRVFGTVLPTHLKPTIYPSSKGVTVKERLQTKDMFTMALRSEPSADNNLKSLCISLGLEQATLRHRGDRGFTWLTQLMDVLDVVDYPVPGYTPSTVMSEMHVHLWDCAVDYRPLYLPIRSVLTLGNFSVSSNVIPETNMSQLSFLAQECALFLRHAKSKAHDVDRPPDVHADYVCVLDVGLFELALKTADKNHTPQPNQPPLELTAANNMVNLYTCWDSASALCRLLTYVAADGDTQLPYDRSRQTSVCSDQPIEQLVGLEDRPSEEMRELSPNEIQQVNDLMAEAMKESPDTTLEDDELNSSVEKDGVEIFFFPDESNMKKQQSAEGIDNEAETKSIDFAETKCSLESLNRKPTNAQVSRDLGDPTSTPKSTPRRTKRKKFKSGGDTSNTDDEYCIVDESFSRDDEMEEPVVQWFGVEPAYMTENHFNSPQTRTNVLDAPKSFPSPVLRYTLCELSLTWNMFGGSDFQLNDSHAKKTVDADYRQGSPTTTRHSKDYETYAGVPSAGMYRRGVSWAAGSERVRPAQPPARPLRSRGGRLRDLNTCVKLCLTKVKFQHEVYPPGGSQASMQTLAVAKIEVLDRLECSEINKLLSQYKMQGQHERKNAHMLIVRAVHLRADAALPAQECCLKVSLLPLRFNLDQDTLAFLVGYFSKFGTDDNSDEDTKSLSGASESGGSRQTTPTHRPPVMCIASHLRDPPPTPTSLGDADSLSINETVMRDEEPVMENYVAERLVSENLIHLEEDFHRLGISQEKPVAKPPDAEPVDDSPIYFRRVVFSPEVPIRLDYVGKRVDLSAGPVAGLVMGLGHLDCSELTLKRLDYKLGLLGLEKLVQWALHEWLADIKRHQLPSLLSGIGPMHSLLQIITGIRDLVWLPVEQWRRDGRLVHGLRRGAASFTARTAVAALDLTARLLHLIQATAETAFDMLTPHPALQLTDARELRARRRRRRRDPARPPADIREGVASAYNTVRDGFAETAANMSAAARRGAGGGVLRQLPAAALAPLALAAAGAADVLGGVRAHLAPHMAHDLADKWRAPAEDRNEE